MEGGGVSNHADFFCFHAFTQLEENLKQNWLEKMPITQSRRPIGGPLRCSYKIDIFEEKSGSSDQ